MQSFKMLLSSQKLNSIKQLKDQLLRIQIPYFWYISAPYLRGSVPGAAWGPELHIQRTHIDDLNSSWIQSCPPLQEAMLVPCEEGLGHLTCPINYVMLLRGTSEDSRAKHCALGFSAPTQPLAPVPFLPPGLSSRIRPEVAQSSDWAA